MIYLLFSILCSVLIANFLMYIGKKGSINMLPVFLGNYFVASVFSYFSLPAIHTCPPRFDLWFGIISGALFLANFWVYQKCIMANGLSLSVGAMRIAMIVPILLAVILFREGLNIYNALGIGMGILAFGLKANPAELRNFLWILGLFLISGLTDASMKIYKEFGRGNEAHFVYIIFSSAFIFTALAIISGKISIPLSALLYGFALGLPNRMSTVFFLKGLSTVPASVAYPIVAVSIVLFSILSDIVIWNRRAEKRDYLLWLLLILSLILLNL